MNHLNNQYLLNAENKKNDYEINNKIIEEQICCIELTNNNYIYIKYEDNWTIKDVRI